MQLRVCVCVCAFCHTCQLQDVAVVGVSVCACVCVCYWPLQLCGPFRLSWLVGRSSLFCQPSPILDPTQTQREFLPSLFPSPSYLHYSCYKYSSCCSVWSSPMLLVSPPPSCAARTPVLSLLSVLTIPLQPAPPPPFLPSPMSQAYPVWRNPVSAQHARFHPPAHPPCCPCPPLLPFPLASWLLPCSPVLPSHST